MCCQKLVYVLKISLYRWAELKLYFVIDCEKKKKVFLRLKKRFYTFHLNKGGSVQDHLDEFNKLIIDLEIIGIKL